MTAMNVTEMQWQTLLAQWLWLNEMVSIV